MTSRPLTPATARDHLRYLAVKRVEELERNPYQMPLILVDPAELLLALGEPAPAPANHHPGDPPFYP